MRLVDVDAETKKLQKQIVTNNDKILQLSNEQADGKVLQQLETENIILSLKISLLNSCQTVNL